MWTSEGFSSSGPGWPPPEVAAAGARGNRDSVDPPAEDPKTDEQPSDEESP
jgi:hypothetical protein